MKHKLISVIVPVYNEEAGLAIFHKSLTKILKPLSYDFEILYIEDGSRDNTVEILRTLQKKDVRVRPIVFAKNFGKEMATTAGLHQALGDAALVLDGDGQHPVELIPDFMQKWEQGADAVIGVRSANQKEGLVKKAGSKLFYFILHRLGVDATPGTTDFRLVDRQVIDEFKQLKEHNRITRALLDWLGYTKEIIYFTAKPREYGEASYSIRKLTQLALNGFVSLSFLPLYISGYLGIVITLLSSIAAIFVVIEKYFLLDPLNLNVTGTALLGIFILFLVGILLIGQGLLAIYVARIYIETQNRSLYVIRRK